MKKSFLALFVFSVSILVLPVSSYASFPRYSDIHSKIQTNRSEAQTQRTQFHEDHLGERVVIKNSLSDEQTQDLLEIQDNFENAITPLQNELKTTTAYYAREEILGEIKEIVAYYYAQIENIVDGNDMAENFVSERYTVFQHNEDLREKNRKLRFDYIQDMQDLIDDLIDANY